MLDLLIYVGSALIITFGFVLFFGAPYLPTMRAQVEQALDMLDLRPGQRLLELGSGDGRFMRAAARRGIHCVGYEINPLLVWWSRLVCWRYRDLVEVRMANYWSVQWPKADGIYAFILQKYMGKLDNKIMQYVEGSGKCKLVSYTFTVPEREPVESKKGLFLYEY